MKNHVLIFDLDDTLIITNPEFEKTNRLCAEQISENISGDHSLVPDILKRQLEIDLSFVEKYGFVRPRYLQSWLHTCNEMFEKHNLIVNESLLFAIELTVQDIYERKYENVPEALDVLAKLKSEGYTMVILTAGEEEIQRKRIVDAGILKYMDDIYVYPYKTPATLKKVTSKYEGKVLYMIGNSLKSDIHPALENNIWGIHVQRDTWKADHYDIDESDPLYVPIPNLSILPSTLSFLNY